MSLIKREAKTLLLGSAGFLVVYFLPVGKGRFDNAMLEALALAKWYAREHVLLCLVPAFLIAGAIAVFVSQGSVMKYLGARANKLLAYSVAGVSGSVLAVCSCTVLPLFAGIFRMGAGLGPATAFLYAGPAINVLAVVLTAKVLGVEMGIARATGAICFSVVIGLLMHLFFRRDEAAKSQAQAALPEPEVVRPLWQNTLLFVSLVGVLVFANWAKPGEAAGFWAVFYSTKWFLTAFCATALGVFLGLWFRVAWWKLALGGLVVLGLGLTGLPQVAFVTGVLGLALFLGTTGGESRAWLSSAWDLAKQITPLLLLGVLAAGLLLGRPGGEGVIPQSWVAGAVGGNSLAANLFAALAGALMYFATLTEVPVLEGLMASGMGKGPALALLLAGPAVSLPNLLVIRSVMGTAKTLVFVCLVVVMATASGVIYGALF